ncbi:MAG: PQQ-binding-like beta-propeller repeat protein [Planctomycetes bacterium]|nr:PQQ-binding-like beta-propeller repeat protein [Planctomycetota bacterium]
MNNTKRGRTMVVACAVLIGAASVGAQDWPQWRGANRDGKAAGFTAPEKWPAQLAPQWKATVGTGDATPALVGDKLYVFSRQGDEEVLSCLNAADGKEVWKDKYTAQAVSGPAARHPGPRSSPAVADGKIVTLGVAGVVSCWDTSGKLLWRKDPFPKVTPRFFTSMSPIVVAGKAIVHVGAAGNGAIIAFDLASGDEKWRWGAEGPDYGSPALMTVDGVQQIVTLTEKSIVGLTAADGKQAWLLPFPIQGRAYNAPTPIIDGQTVIYMGSGRGIRAVKIEKKGEGFAAGELWSNPEVAPQYNTPVLRDGILFGLSDKGNLFCVDAKTGKTAWIDQTKRDGSGFGAVVSAGSCLMVLPSSSELTVFKPDAKQYQEVAKIKVSDTQSYASPVPAGRRIFVKDQESVLMLTVQ